MGALIMAHSDDLGLVLPPKLAPYQVVIVPIPNKELEPDAFKFALKPVIDELKSYGVSVKYDDNENYKPGWKFAEYELKGVPIRMAIGMRDLQAGQIEIARRDTLTKETRPLEGVASYVRDLLDEIQSAIYQKAFKFRQENMFKIDTWEEFEEQIGNAARERIGVERWTKRVIKAIAKYNQFLYYDHCFVGGGNAKHIKGLDLGPKVTRVSNRAGLVGGARIWDLEAS
jgi:prolyl-tRNA synthetase